RKESNNDISENSNEGEKSPLERENPGQEQVFEPAEPYPVKRLSPPVSDSIRRSSSGRRSKSLSSSKNGRYVDSIIPRGKVVDLAFDATLRAAAPHQIERRKLEDAQAALIIEKWDLREKIRERKIGNIILFVVDASGSMAAENRMAAAKGAIMSLLLDAYQRRDQVGMIVFRKETAELVLPPTKSVELAEKLLNEIPTGGRTPLAHGLELALDTIRGYMAKDRNAVPLLVLVSDGKANVSFMGGDPVEDAKAIAREIRAHNINSLIVDTEQDYVKLGFMRDLSTEIGGKYLHLEELDASHLASAVLAWRGRSNED
ncbi:MAG: VWA domain-containing protein, partial [Candidatus Bathyarchaeia archaeon]